jgi:hypothetical protein
MNARDANNKSIRDVIYAVLIVMLFDNRSVTLRCRAVRAVINRFGHNSQVYDESFLGRRKNRRVQPRGLPARNNYNRCAMFSTHVTCFTTDGRSTRVRRAVDPLKSSQTLGRAPARTRARIDDDATMKYLSSKYGGGGLVAFADGCRKSYNQISSIQFERRRCSC